MTLTTGSDSMKGSAWTSYGGTLMESWNGVSLLKNHIQHLPGVHVFTNASGSWGVWCHVEQQLISIPMVYQPGNCKYSSKELVPVFLTTALWGKHLHAKHIQFHLNNMAVVRKYATIMHLLCCLHFL